MIGFTVGGRTTYSCPSPLTLISEQSSVLVQTQDGPAICCLSLKFIIACD